MNRQYSVIVKGRFRDKMQLIKVGCDKVRKENGFKGHLDPIKVGDYEPDLDGHILVLEEAGKDRLSVTGGDKAHA